MNKKPQPQSPALTHTNTTPGFTIIELLIVIVVIAILAAISIVTYNGIQQRARDTQRVQDIQTIAKALEMYYTVHGEYPNGACGSSCPDPKKVGGSWATTSDGSWSVLEAALVPGYISALPSDPLASIHTNSPTAGAAAGYNYDYVRWTGCSHTSAQYLLVYRLESQAPRRDIQGQCQGSGAAADYSLGSEYVVFK